MKKAYYAEPGPRIAGAHGAEIWRVICETITPFGAPGPAADLDIDYVAEGLTREQAVQRAGELNRATAEQARSSRYHMAEQPAP